MTFLHVLNSSLRKSPNFHVDSCIAQVPLQTMSIGQLRPLLGTFVVNLRREKQTRKSGHSSWHPAYTTSISEPHQHISIYQTETLSLIQLDLRPWKIKSFLDLNQMEEAGPKESTSSFAAGKYNAKSIGPIGQPCFTPALSSPTKTLTTRSEWNFIICLFIL